MRRACIAAICCWLALLALPARAATYFVTVSGLGGEPDYEQRFTGLAKDLDRILRGSGGDARVYTLMGGEATRAHLSQVLGEVASKAAPEDDFVLTLIGHGSFDGFEYKFNLPGPDISGAELAALCDRIRSRRQLIVNTTSASGGSIAALERPGRAVIAATKSGTEKNATVFARYWVEALEDATADTDKNEAITALEAFNYADAKTAEFYRSQQRLATEHAVFEDTGKGQPVRVASLAGAAAPASVEGDSPTAREDVAPAAREGLLLANFTLIRMGNTLRAASDPAKRALIAQKEALEQKIDVLKYQKAAMDPSEYKTQLTQALLDLARVQQELDK